MEKREYPVFDLVVANQKPKFAESKPAEIHVYQDGSLVCYAIANAPDSFKDEGCTMADLIRLLRIYWSSLGRSVVDKTELTGRYNFELHWTREGADDSIPMAGDSPSLATALQEQLGLKLAPDKALLDVIIIDHVEMPSEN